MSENGGTRYETALNDPGGKHDPSYARAGFFAELRIAVDEIEECTPQAGKADGGQ